jgi:wyosine [tRNA(Phe)-imidazoG37] synthetase (radical SAM superfamily)
MTEEEVEASRPIFVRIGKQAQIQRPTIQPNIERINQTLSQLNQTVNALLAARPRIVQTLVANRLEMLSEKLQALNIQAVQQKQEEKKPETVECPYCGEEIPKEAKFCPNCGYKLEAERPRYGLRR